LKLVKQINGLEEQKLKKASSSKINLTELPIKKFCQFNLKVFKFYLKIKRKIENNQ